MKRVLVILFLLIVALHGVGCSDDDNGGTTPAVVDTADPVPGNSGVLTLSGVSTNSISITWTVATDDVCTNLQYRVVFSTNSMADAETNGTTVLDWTEGTTTVQLTGLKACWPYYINVLVRDQSNHKAVYSGLYQWTQAPCPSFATGQTSQVTPGDDGDLEKGTAWPVPRFTNNGDGTVTDHLTGLIWQRAAPAAAMTWDMAVL